MPGSIRTVAARVVLQLRVMSPSGFVPEQGSTETGRLAEIDVDAETLRYFPATVIGDLDGDIIPPALGPDGRHWTSPVAESMVIPAGALSRA